MPTYTPTLLRAGSFKLDAGSMFGLIPRSVWSRSGVQVDAQDRITVAHNCLLLKPSAQDAASAPFKHVLIETGSGGKLDAKMQAVFDFEKLPPAADGSQRPRTIVDALAEHNVSPEQIDAVVVSHLHFDHAGGLTRLPHPGEEPIWKVPPNIDGGGGSSQRGGACITFPNAKIFTQLREWQDAIANRSVMTKTYYPDHLWPIADKIVTLDSPRPFPTGLTPERDELPTTPIDYRLTEIAKDAGVYVFNVPGHTWGQQAVLFREPPASPSAPHAKGRTIVFVPDVLPTAHHLGSAYSLAYDVEPYTSMLSRRWLLTEAAANDWTLHLDHEPGHPLFKVKANTKGWFDLIPELL